MVRWVIIVTASALVVVFTACTGMGIETHPVSGVPTETKMAELPSDPPARLSGTVGPSRIAGPSSPALFPWLAIDLGHLH